MGRVQAASAAPSAAIVRGLFYGNRALCSPENPEDPDGWVNDGLGGAVHVKDNSSLAVDSCAFILNEASSNGFSTPQINQAEGVRFGGNGGAISVDQGGKLRIANSGLLRNTAGWAGGGINASTWSGAPSSTVLEIYFSTIHENQAKWGCGLNNYAATLTGFGNIVFKNLSTNQWGGFNDLGNTTQVASRSSIRESVFTYGSSFNDNTGANHYYSEQGTLPEIFVDPTNLAGGDGEWGTSDDGFRLLPGSLPLNKVLSRPPDFADADGDGNTSELLPFDAKGDPFGNSPFDCGPYQQ